MTELQALKGKPEYSKTKRLSVLATWAARWSPTRKRAGLSGLRDADGKPVHDHDVCFDLVSNHWGLQFSGSSIDESKAKDFLQQWARRIPRVQWQLTYDAFLSLLDGLHDSAPGPDGLPYSAWKFVPNSIRGLLYGAYLEWLAGAPLSEAANNAFLALVPKGTHNEDGPAGIFRAAGETRPLSLSNSDVDIFASAIRIACESAISDWAHFSQRGFLSSRVMLENVVDVETRGFELTCDPDIEIGDSAVRPPSMSPATLLFDYGVAFPSLSQDFLWLCLAAIGFPVFIINATKQL